MGEAPASAAVDFLEGAEVEIIDPRLPSIAVEPNVGEEGDANFPRNLHNAAELLIRTGSVDAFKRLQRCTRAFFELFERGAGDDDVVGRACVCWRCGHCGLERQPPESSTQG